MARIEERVDNGKSVLSLWTLLKCWFLSSQLIAVLTSYTRYYATGFLGGLLPALRKLYKDRPEELRDAMKAYGERYYLAEQAIGSSLSGAVLSMEVQKAAGADISRDFINDFKTGVMGALTGFGDTIWTGTLRPLSLAISVPYCLEGKLFGAFLNFLLETCVRQGTSIIAFFTGYKLGGAAVSKILKRGATVLKRLAEGAIVLSMMTMGGMVSTYVKPSFALAWKIGEKTTTLDDFISSILPGLVPLATVLIFYFLLKKNVKTTTIILGVLAFSILGTLVGLFG